MKYHQTEKKKTALKTKRNGITNSTNRKCGILFQGLSIQNRVSKNKSLQTLMTKLTNKFITEYNSCVPTYNTV